MDWQRTNENARLTWATRTQPQSFVQHGPDGIAIEHMVALANEANADPWFALPWNADEEYLTRFAEYVRDNLRPDRRVYIEVSNEVWNGAFPVFHQAQAEAAAANLSAGTLGRYAQRSVEVFRIWERAFGSEGRRMVRVVAMQHANPWTAEQVLSFEDTAQHVDALATAPYFGHDLFSHCQRSIDEHFIQLGVDLDQTLAQMDQNKAVAQRYGLRYVTYEGGQHVVSNDVQLVTSINRHPRMYELYGRYLNGWKQRVGDSLLLYASTVKTGSFGAWGLREYAGQPLEQAPKHRAVLDYAATNADR